MTFTLATTQAPNSSYLNGGTAADARQYYLRPTQRTPNGPRIAAAISGIAAGEVRTITTDKPGGAFNVYSAVIPNSYGILDWNPYGAWHVASEQLVFGGKRRIQKVIIYSDITGEMYVPAMPRDFVGTDSDGHWYGRTATDGDKVELASRFFDPVTNAFGATLTGLPAGYNSHGWFPDYGSSGAWVANTDTGEMYVWPDPSGPVALFATHGHGRQQLMGYHPQHHKMLVLDGFGTTRKASLVASDGTVTVCTDTPIDLTLSSATPGVLPHPSGCWIVPAGSTDRRVLAYWPDSDQWVDTGPDAFDSNKDPTYTWDAARQVAYVATTDGIYAWKLPVVTDPAGAIVAIGASLSDSASINAGAAIQTHTVSGADAAESATLSSATVIVGANVVAAGANLSDAATLSAGTIAQTQIIAGAAAADSATLSSATVIVGANVVAAGANLSDAATLSAGTIDQTHTVIAAGAADSAALTGATIVVTGNVVVSAINLADAATVGTAAVAQNHRVVAAGLSDSASATGAAVVVSSAGQFAGANAADSAALSGGAIVQTHAFVGSSLFDVATLTGGRASDGTQALSPIPPAVLLYVAPQAPRAVR